MELDQLRKDTIERVEEVLPHTQESVWNPDAFRSHYLTPYRARDLKALDGYERSHHTIFCRSCLKRDDTKGILLVHQLWIEARDNELEGEDEAWLSLQCQNPDCDFDLVTPVPERQRQKSIEELLEQLRISEQQARLHPPYYPGTWIGTGTANTPTITYPAGGFNTTNATVQQSPAAQGQALSSASTLGAQAAPQTKQSTFDKLVTKYLR